MPFSNTRGWAAVAALAGAVGFAVAGFTGLALGRATQTTLKTSHSATLGKRIAVDARGRTVYELRPETTKHLLCTSKACFQFWPPVTVKSRKVKLSKATGISGKLGLLHRDGFFQVTLGGRPLYRYAGDKARGDANGQGIVAFGGTWHVVTASSHKTGSSPMTTGSSTTGYY
jgi:predicted lipoprotein with Yx(FWY)xxD motif